MSFLAIIEGLDRTGKSTLARYLAEDLTKQDAFEMVRVQHFSKPVQPPIDEYSRPVLHWDVDGAYIFDRYHLGELVWPQIFKRDSTYTAEQHLWIEMLLQSRGAVLVKTQRPMDDIKDALIRDDEDLKPDDAQRAELLFNTVVDLSLLPRFRWELGGSTKSIISAGLHAGAAVRGPLKITHRVIGNLSTTRLLIVDGKETAGLGYPAHPDFDDGQLIGAIAGNENIIRGTAVTSTRIGIRQLWEELWCPPIVAVTDDASHYLSTQGLDHHIAIDPTSEQLAERMSS